MKRSKHSLSNYKLLSAQMGSLIPIGLTEVIPGDTVQHATSALIRTNPLVAPIMHPVHVRIHHWFVPLRTIWDDFEDFITGGEDGMDESVYPTITSPAITGFAESSLADYLGVTPGVPDFAVSALPFRAYAQVFNEYYRDQDLTNTLNLTKASGEDFSTNTTLVNICWEKDYITSARPWTQKGPAVTLPIGTTAPVLTNDEVVLFKGGTMGESSVTVNNTDSILRRTLGTPGSPDTLRFGTETGLFTDLEESTSVDINQVRLAFALQRYEEARARYGSRYTEYLRYLGVRSSDSRLQRPEYLGGGKQTIQFSEVLQTAPEDDANPVGALKGHGIGALRSNRYRRFFEEHGYVLTLLSVRPKTIYAQALHRTWNRRVKEDFWQKELEHVGQQEILNKEVYMPSADPDGVFGYQDRYDEYRRAESSVSGAFRSTLNYWHMARIFESDPTLNGTFVGCYPTTRTFADETQDPLLIMANHSIQARRLVSKTGSSFIY